MARMTGFKATFWERAAAYLIGRNALIGAASMMLLAISGYATWSGMSDFIVGVSTAPARDLPGGLGLSVPNELFVIVIVVALTFLMWLSLRESFRPRTQRRGTTRNREQKTEAHGKIWRFRPHTVTGESSSTLERLVTFLLYLFLALWSVGFGYGFWWSLIAGEEATRTSLANLQEDARDATATIVARLDAVNAQINNVASWSDGQMAREESSGGSCGKPSGAGRGPLYNARRSVRDSIVTLRDGVVQNWLEPVQADVQQLRKAAAGLSGDTVAERQRSFERTAFTIRGRARNIVARSNALGTSTAAEMRALADAVSIPPGKTGFSCYDPTLAQRLRQAADQAATPAVLNLREAAFNEGPAGVANAVKNLWANIGALVSNVFTFLTNGFVWPDSEGGGTPITGRDLIALLATLGIDVGLFVLTIMNPPARIDDGLEYNAAYLNLPSEEVQKRIGNALATAIARAPSATGEWVLQHFIHHNTASYLVIPNLYAVQDTDDGREQRRALAMNQFAGVLDDLDLVRWPTKEELEGLIAEESLESMTDLVSIRKARLEELKSDGHDVPEDEWDKVRDRIPLRNHGLFSKAERMLRIAEWSETAARDIEIFKLVDTEGLTPLLIVLNNADFNWHHRDAETAPAPEEGD